MRNTSRFVLVGATVLAAGALLQGSASGSTANAEHGGGGATTLRFHVVFSPFNYTDLGAPGPSAADVIVFHDQLFQGGRNVGDEVGSCVVVEASGLSNCTAVVRLTDRGTVTFAFANSPPPRKILAITGGSGQFRTTRGDGTLQEAGDGTGTLTLHLVR